MYIFPEMKTDVNDLRTVELYIRVKLLPPGGQRGPTLHPET